MLADLPFVGPGAVPPAPDGLSRDRCWRSALAWFLYRSRAGLVLRAVGESPESAHALGYPVRRIRLAAVMVGGALCGVAGAYISVVYTPLWVEGMVAGKGWIALALTTFATWRPARVLLGAYLFGGVTMLQFHLQGQGVEIPSQFLSMLPYVATIVVLVLISRNAGLDPRQHAGVAGQAVLPRVLSAHGVDNLARITPIPFTLTGENPMTASSKRSLIKLAGWSAIAAAAALVGCGKKEEAPAAGGARRGAGIGRRRPSPSR